MNVAITFFCKLSPFAFCLIGVTQNIASTISTTLNEAKGICGFDKASSTWFTSLCCLDSETSSQAEHVAGDGTSSGGVDVKCGEPESINTLQVKWVGKF